MKCDLKQQLKPRYVFWQEKVVPRQNTVHGDLLMKNSENRCAHRHEKIVPIQYNAM